LDDAMSGGSGLIKSALIVAALAPLLIPGTTDGAAQQRKYTGARGCGAIFVFAWTEDQTEDIIVSADRVQLGLHAGDNTVRITPDRKGLEVTLELYGRPQRDLPAYHCNDVRLQEWDRPVRTLSAVSGTLLITLGEPGTAKPENGVPPFAYEATVVLRDVGFRRPDGTTVSIRAPITLKAFVGYVAG
jgi:hypothetical protein